jgi:hypothetical protein
MQWRLLIRLQLFCLTSSILFSNTYSFTKKPVFAACPIPLSSISKEAINDFGSPTASSPKIITPSPYKKKLEKRREDKSTDTGKKLHSPKPLVKRFTV